jgi:hypothetical protein
MNEAISRRDFLKVAGLGVGAMAFKPSKLLCPSMNIFLRPNDCRNFPASEIIGRVVDVGVPISQPSHQ